jgi:hypothetical protein
MKFTKTTIENITVSKILSLRYVVQIIPLTQLCNFHNDHCGKNSLGFHILYGCRLMSCTSFFVTLKLDRSRKRQSPFIM